MSAITLLKKSALAIAIASVSVSAYSVETLKDVTLSPAKPIYSLNGGDFTGGLKVNGVTGVINFDSLDEELEGVVSIENGTEIEGDVVVDATINMVGNDASGITISSGSVKGTSTSVDGNVVNNGKIKFSGDIGYGISISAGDDDSSFVRTEIFGDLINNGSIELTQIENPEFSLAENEPATGIELGFTDIENVINSDTGKIIVNGKSVTGIYATNNTIINRDTGETGFIKNSGLIEVSGDQARGILVDGKSKIGTIENTGTISVVANKVDSKDLKKSGGIVVNDAQVSFIENKKGGEIKAEGAGAAAIYLEKNKSYNGETSYTTIVNNGDIIGRNGALAINAEEANGNKSGTRLNWDSGRIEGDVKGIYNVRIKDEVTFDGEKFGALIFSIGVGGGSKPIVNFTKPHTVLDTRTEDGTANRVDVKDKAKLVVQITDKTKQDKAIIRVIGDANFSGGAGIVVGSATELNIVGKEYILLSTTGKLTTIKDDFKVYESGFVKVNSFKADDANKKITANVSLKKGDEIVDDVIDAGGDKNTQVVAKELTVLLDQLAKIDPDFQERVLAAGVIDSVAAIKELSPEVNGAAAQAAASSQTIISGATSSRTSSLRGKSSGEALKETGVWMQTLYSDASQGTRDGIKGYNAYSSGLAIGADGKPSDDVTVGVAYSYLNTTVNGKSNSTTDVKGHAFTLYGGYEMGNYFVDGNLTYSTNTNDSKRNVFGTVAKGDYDSDMLGASVTGGYTFNLDNNFVVEPLVAARYANIKIDSFSEKGSPAALRTGSQRYEIAELGLGARASTNYAVGQGTLEPQVQVMALHDLAADQTKSTSAFVAAGNPFVASGAKPVRNSYEASVGADYRLGALTFGANYGYTGKTGFNADTFSAKVRYDF